MTNYTSTQLEFIKKNQGLITRKELASLFNNEFKENKTVQAIRKVCIYYKWSTERVGLTNKGTPWNKGTKGIMKANKGSKLKGCKALVIAELGTERVSNGYIEVRTSDKPYWKAKHRLIYEKEHGEIREGEVIRFIDNDKTNFDINNLISVSRKANVTINRHGKANTENAELNKAIIINQIIKTKVKEITE